MTDTNADPGTRPAALCPTHTRHVAGWRALRYDPRNPTEWPGGSHIMDSRTTHAERAAGWERKTAEQIALVEEICRSGRSPQCDRPADAATAPFVSAWAGVL